MIKKRVDSSKYSVSNFTIKCCNVTSKVYISIDYYPTEILFIPSKQLLVLLICCKKVIRFSTDFICSHENGTRFNLGLPLLIFSKILVFLRRRSFILKDNTFFFPWCRYISPIFYWFSRQKKSYYIFYLVMQHDHSVANCTYSISSLV